MSYERFRAIYPLPSGPYTNDDMRRFERRLPSPSKSKRRAVWLVTLIFAASLFALVASAAHGAPHNPIDAVVMVRTQYGDGKFGGGSGVVISPDGRVLTAEHVVAGGEIESVTYRGRKYPAKGLVNNLQKNGIDEAYLLKFDPPEPVVYLPVSERLPEVGDVVYAFGYPALEYYSSQIAQVVAIAEKTGEVAINAWVIEGNSGGPLLNADGEVIGLASTRNALPPLGSEPGSYWVGLQWIRAAINRQNAKNAEAQEKRENSLLYFSTTWCGPCKQMAPIVAKLIKEGLPIRKIDVDKRPDQAKLYAVRSVPTFVLLVDGVERERVIGLTSEARLRKMIKKTGPERFERATTIEDLFKPKPEPKPDFEVPPLPADAAPGAEVDWSLVKIVVLRSNPELSQQTGAAIAVLQDRLSGPFRRRLQEVTGGKADIQLVHQQATPARHAAVSSAIGREAGALLVVVMTRQQDLGLIKGTIASQVQTALAGYIEGKVPVEIVSERLHPSDYAAVEAALLTQEEPATDPEENAPWWIAGVSALVSFVAGYVINFIQRRRKAKADE